MDVLTISKNHYTIVVVKGRLDSLTADNLQACLSALFNEGIIFLIVDCTALEFLSSSGMRAILISLKELEKLGGRLLFASCRQPILEVLELSGIGKYLELFPSLTDAERAINHISRS